MAAVTISNKPIDSHRILLTNVPMPIDQDYLEVYLEYLSNEVEVETVHKGNEIKNSIFVTYIKSIDFEQVRLNHERKPNILSNRTNLFQVNMPNILLVGVEETTTSDQHSQPELFKEYFNKEFLEMYFSNRKRSGGERIRSILLDKENRRAYILFESSQSKLLLFFSF